MGGLGLTDNDHDNNYNKNNDNSVHSLLLDYNRSEMFLSLYKRVRPLILP